MENAVQESLPAVPFFLGGSEAFVFAILVALAVVLAVMVAAGWTWVVRRWVRRAPSDRGS
jgi:hypothetical protein